MGLGRRKTFLEGDLTMSGTKTRKMLGVLAAVVVMCVIGVPQAGASPLVADTFTRVDGGAIGSTEIPSPGYDWIQAVGTNARIYSNQLKLFYVLGGNTDNTIRAYVDDFTIADLDVEVKINQTYTSASSSRRAYLRYRTDACDGGYSVDLYVCAGANNKITLTGGGLTTVTYTTNIVPSTYYAIRVLAVGNHHQVYLDGSKIIDVYDTGAAAINTAGHVGLGQYVQKAYFDDFSVDIPEPATLCLLGLGGIGILVRRRRRS